MRKRLGLCDAAVGGCQNLLEQVSQAGWGSLWLCCLPTIACGLREVVLVLRLRGEGKCFSDRSGAICDLPRLEARLLRQGRVKEVVGDRDGPMG